MAMNCAAKKDWATLSGTHAVGMGINSGVLNLLVSRLGYHLVLGQGLAILAVV